MKQANEAATVLAPFTANDVVGKDSSALAEQLAAEVADCLRLAISDKGHATLVVSGGSTPLPFFKALSNSDISWEKVTVTLADERWVSAHHEDSNEKLVRENLLVSAAGSATFISLKNAAASPQEGWVEAEAAIASMPRPLDVVVLGMGGDGHTASLFPDTDGLEQALTIGCGKLTWPMNPPGAKQPRMSLTLDTLIDAKSCFLHVTGDNKRAVIQQAISESQQYPIAAVIKAAGRKLKIFWAP